ncbi:histidine phosphatase family protein [Candidatus Parcubacteria bacterium]|uniref:Histidine phosphatase family protein n=1 Tax=Candidatus Kaiserbacteria bacterium CG10_big_fil_rev_8_21_14_0_10_47_16 TaxID=1974608 RepID=A0A2H0UEN4_9BACT|nr:histidine phosphatase family protein [Candidatus Parcubacteria bacterium]PIR84884.1 MAG: hypothetical protein COU16_00275 [Candidatus Kaiserbacteria bacterium CG10_big_fil_rev_8_21_14_0_10_47_16]
MYIHFIRHGETEYNRKHLHQGLDVPLSLKGRQQIQKTAEKLAGFQPPITKLITSDLARTVESAEIIGRALELTLEPNVLFREVQRPTFLYNKHHFGLGSIQASIPMLTHLHNPHWHYSDEENLSDLQDRVIEAVAYLKEVGKEHEHVAVVSHAFILNIFIKYMCSSPEHRVVRIPDYIATLLGAKKLHNASITTLMFNEDENPNTCDWILTAYNDHDHLA